MLIDVYGGNRHCLEMLKDVTSFQIDPQKRNKSFGWNQSKGVLLDASKALKQKKEKKTSQKMTSKISILQINSCFKSKKHTLWGSDTSPLPLGTF